MDQEPITIIMTVIPIVGRGIYLLAKKINSIVQNMSSNKKDWQELNGHIQEVMRCLKYIDSNVKIHREVQSSIHNLAMCIEECWKFLQDYIHASALQQLIFHHHFRRKFEELNERLVAWKDRFLFVVSAYQLAKSSQTRNTVPIIQKPSVQPHHLAFLSPVSIHISLYF